MKKDVAPEKIQGSDFKLLTKLFFRLLPYQILLIVINAVNNIVDSLFASNALGADAMSAMGYFAPMNHFLYALSIMLVSGSTLLYGLYISNIMNGFICAAVVIAFSWKAIGHRPKNVEDLLAIPDSFGVSANDRIDITVRSIAQVEDISEKVIEFCTERGIDRRRAFFSGLAMEEMAGNVILHGFTKDPKRKHSVDIRIARKGDEMILRLRDDCPPFDPAYRAQLLSEEDKIKNIGIRLVFDIAKEVQYQNLLGLNVLTIHI